MRVKLTNIGRGKFCGEVNVSTYNSLLKEIGKHLMSREVDIVAPVGSSKGDVLAGFHTVGQVELIDGVFKHIRAGIDLVDIMPTK